MSKVETWDDIMFHTGNQLYATDFVRALKKYYPVPPIRNTEHDDEQEDEEFEETTGPPYCECNISSGEQIGSHCSLCNKPRA